MRGNIKEIANSLSKKYKTNDPFVLADYLNIHVFDWPLHEDINGLYQYDKREKFIFLNQTLSDFAQIIVCAHEVGHAVLHKNINYTFFKTHTFYNLSKFENEANLFCVEFILPDSKLHNYKEYSLQQIASLENIPLELLKLKFK